MANKRTDVESVINLVINGKQAQTSLKELTDTQRKLNSEIRNMKPSDPGYKKIEREVQMVNKALDEQKKKLRGIDEETSKLHSSWKEISAGVAIGNIFSQGLDIAKSAIFGFISGSQEAYSEAVKGQAQLEAVIESTGQIAGKTKDSLNEMSEALMKKTGVDDDVITKGQQMLLTFTNVRNEIFDQAVPAILDMSSAMNGGAVTMESMQTTAIQVGKALNDPLKGITALKKVGVTFTEDQKKVIKKLQETGDMAGAQTVILKELAKEFGGVAEKVANIEDEGKLQKFNTRLGNIQENVGGTISRLKAGLASAFDPFLSWVEKVTSTPMSETLEQERISLNELELKITSTNTKQEDRIKLINELKSKAPDILKDLKAETANNMEVAKAVKMVNDQLVNEIILAKQDEKIEEQNATTAEGRIQILEVEDKIRKRLVKLREKYPEFKLPDNANDAQKLESFLNQYIARQNKLGKTVGGIFDDTYGAAPLLNRYNDLVKLTNSSLRETDFLISKKKEIMDRLGIKDIVVPEIKPTSNDFPIVVDESKVKKEQELLKKLKEDLIRNSEEVYQNMLSKEDKEVRQLQIKYEELRKNGKLSAEQRIQLENDYGNEMLTLTKKFQSEENELKKKNTAEAEKIAKEKGEKIVQRHLEDWSAYYDTIVSDHQKEIDAVNAKYEKMFAIAEQYGMDMMDLELMWAAEINAIEDKPDSGKKKKMTRLEELKEYKKAALEVAQTVADTSFNIGAQKRQAETDAKLSELEKQRQLELDNAEGNEKAKEEINVRYAEAEKAEKLRAWEANRQASITQALINGALAATNIWATTPKADFGVSTYIMLGLAAASTIASVATISAAEPPEFATGVRGFGGGVAKVGEAGWELINEDDKWWLADRPTFADLAPGTDVYNASDTSKILRERMYPVSSYSFNTEAVNNAEVSYRSNATLPAAQADNIYKKKVQKDPELAELRSMVRSLAQTVGQQATIPVVFDFNTYESKQKRLQFDRNQQGG